MTNSSRLGFTLVELLIAIAILGILVSGALAVINPFEQINKAKDMTLIQATRQVYDAAVQYEALYGGPAPVTGTNGQQALLNSGELKRIINISGKPNYYLDTWTPNPNVFQVDSGALSSKANREKAISIRAAGGPSNCNGTQTNTMVYHNSLSGGRQSWYCW